MGFANFITNKFFNIIHRGNLVYNQCWEDPRLDREALKIDDQSVIVCITSAGCNILDYLLDSPKKIYAVDMNPRQNHLLELKIAGIRSLDFETFFQFFGYGQFKGSREIYKTKLRHKLSPSAGIFWDKNIEYFSGGGWRSSFYFRGTSGTFARIVNSYINYIPGMRPAIDALVNSKSIQEQAVIYSVICHKFWRGAINWLMNRSATLSLLGIPRAQRTVLERRYDGRIGKFARERVDQVFSKMNFSDNYFWRVYLTGSYTKDCCPEYLKEANFNRLKSGLVDRVSIHTSSIESFLRSKEKTLPINRFVLLDHMDWLAHHRLGDLANEWQAIVNAASPGGARVIWRSAAQVVDFVDPIAVKIKNEQVNMGQLLSYHHETAEALHTRDRVNTYGCFVIADLAVS